MKKYTCTTIERKNRATKAQIAAVDGVSDATADAIIAARGTALFTSIDDVAARVTGVGAATVIKLCNSFFVKRQFDLNNAETSSEDFKEIDGIGSGHC